MAWTAVGTLLLSGFLSLSRATPEKIFHFVREKMDLPSARNHCIENFVDLPSVADVTDLALLSGLVETGDQYAFVGLRRVWKWLILNTEDQREAEITFNKFEEEELEEDRNCGFINPSGGWTMDKCSEDRPFICYDETMSSRFVMVNSHKNFYLAKKHCREHHTELAKVRNEVENQQLVSLCNGTEAWIGLKKTWVWSDGTYTSFLPWGSKKDTDHCTALHITGEPLKIVSWDCNGTLPFFCYTFGRKKYTVGLTLSAAESDVDLGDLAADSVTKLLHSKLRELGFSKDVRLTWRKRPQKVEPPPKPQELDCCMNIGPRENFDAM